MALSQRIQNFTDTGIKKADCSLKPRKVLPYFRRILEVVWDKHTFFGVCAYCKRTMYLEKADLDKERTVLLPYFLEQLACGLDGFSGFTILR